MALYTNLPLHLGNPMLVRPGNVYQAVNQKGWKVDGVSTSELRQETQRRHLRQQSVNTAHLTISIGESSEIRRGGALFM